MNEENKEVFLIILGILSIFLYGVSAYLTWINNMIPYNWYVGMIAIILTILGIILKKVL